jgi:ribosomal protein S18 acetylase RimI-like enzyme
MEPLTITFRPATVADIPVVLPLVESAYRGESSRAGWTTEAHLLDGQRTDVAGLTAKVSSPNGYLLLALDPAGEILGCCELERRPDIAYFGTFAVRPTLQGGGVGGRLLAEAERRIATDWGIGRVEMTVLAQRDDLIAWYERRGYARTGETRPFPYDDQRYGLPRRPDLHFVVLDRKLGR